MAVTALAPGAAATPPLFPMPALPQGVTISATAAGTCAPATIAGARVGVALRDGPFIGCRTATRVLTAASAGRTPRGWTCSPGPRAVSRACWSRLDPLTRVYAVPVGYHFGDCRSAVVGADLRDPCATGSAPIAGQPGGSVQQLRECGTKRFPAGHSLDYLRLLASRYDIVTDHVSCSAARAGIGRVVRSRALRRHLRSPAGWRCEAGPSRGAYTALVGCTVDGGRVYATTAADVP
jgi:hypothetical protein